MFTYEIKTRTPIVYRNDICSKLKNEYLIQFEKMIKTGLKNFLLLDYINNKNNEFNEFVEQTLDLFLLYPKIFLKKEDALSFYIKCSLELEKKELNKNFENIDKIKMKFHVPKQKNVTENIILINSEKIYKAISLTDNITFICKTDKYINFENYVYYVNKIIKNEEKIFNKKYSFFLLNSANKIYSQNFSNNFKEVNFLIINEIYSFLYNLNYKNYKKLNKLLTKNNIKKPEENLLLCTDKHGKISPVNFLDIKQI